MANNRWGWVVGLKSRGREKEREHWMGERFLRVREIIFGVRKFECSLFVTFMNLLLLIIVKILVIITGIIANKY